MNRKYDDLGNDINNIVEALNYFYNKFGEDNEFENNHVWFCFKFEKNRRYGEQIHFFYKNQDSGDLFTLLEKENFSLVFLKDWTLANQEQRDYFYDLYLKMKIKDELETALPNKTDTKKKKTKI